MRGLILDTDDVFRGVRGVISPGGGGVGQGRLHDRVRFEWHPLPGGHREHGLGLDDVVAVSDHCLLLDPRPLRPARLRDRVRDTDHHARPETPQVAVNGSDGDNIRSWAHTRAVHKNWIHEQLGMSGQQIRLDRIFDEAIATGGDLRVLAEMFGLSVASAARYASVVDRVTPPPAA